METIINRKEEKLAIAKEVGAYGVEKFLANEINDKKTIEKITELNLNITNRILLEKKLCNKYLPNLEGAKSHRSDEFTTYTSMRSIACLSIFVTLIIDMVCSTSRGIILPLHLIGMAISSVFTLIACFSVYQKPSLKVIDLEDWREDMPFGALLAIKEAKERGCTDFKVAYPVLDDERITKFRLDPAVIANKRVKVTSELERTMMVEVFAWEDGKIRD